MVYRLVYSQALLCRMNITSHLIEAICVNIMGPVVILLPLQYHFIYVEDDVIDKTQTQIEGNSDFFQSRKYLNIHHSLHFCASSPISDFSNAQTVSTKFRLVTLLKNVCCFYVF